MAEGKKKKHTALVVVVVVVLACAVVAGLLLTGVIGGLSPAEFLTDDRAKDGAMSGLSQEDMLSQLQQSVDESTFSFKINSRPVFKNAQAEGALMIENPATNAYPMSVTIVLDDTGDVVYETKGIMPNQSIETDKLDIELKKGEYAATATIYAYDPDTKQQVGQTAAGLVITIQG